MTGVNTEDHRTFRVTLATPGLGGLYTLRIGPHIVSADGVPMNQDRDTINGETDGGDTYAGTLFVRIVPQTLPYAQSFESVSLASFAGWAFKAQGEFDWGGGDWRIVSSHHPYEGAFHLEATQIADCWTQHDAVLSLDMTGYVGASDLELRFFLQRVASDERNMAKLLISGDGSNWTQVGSATTLLENDGKTRFADSDTDGKLDLVPTLGQYTRYTFDLDRLLVQAGLTTAETVYIDWHRLGFWKDSVTTIDSISVRSLSPPTLAADLNGDGKVGVADIARLQRNWDITTGASRSDGDLNGDGAVTAADLALLVSHLGRTAATTAAAPAAIVARSGRTVARDRLMAQWTGETGSGEDAVSSRVLQVRRRAGQLSEESPIEHDTVDVQTLLRLREFVAQRPMHSTACRGSRRVRGDFQVDDNAKNRRVSRLRGRVDWLTAWKKSGSIVEPRKARSRQVAFPKVCEVLGATVVHFALSNSHPSISSRPNNLGDAIQRSGALPTLAKP